MIELRDFRKENNIDDGDYIFHSGKLKPFETATLTDWAHKIGEMIGVPTLHPHDFRHSGSQLLKLSGMPIEEISDLLHHEDVGTTKKFYLRADKKKIKAEKDKYVF